jgi:hypothetical protein
MVPIELKQSGAILKQNMQNPIFIFLLLKGRHHTIKVAASTVLFNKKYATAKGCGRFL